MSNPTKALTPAAMCQIVKSNQSLDPCYDMLHLTKALTPAAMCQIVKSNQSLNRCCDMLHPTKILKQGRTWGRTAAMSNPIGPEYQMAAWTPVRNRIIFFWAYGFICGWPRPVSSRSAKQPGWRSPPIVTIVTIVRSHKANSREESISTNTCKES